MFQTFFEILPIGWNKRKKPWFSCVFHGFHHKNRICANFHYHIRNQRVKIHNYTVYYYLLYLFGKYSLFWGYVNAWTLVNFEHFILLVLVSDLILVINHFILIDFSSNELKTTKCIARIQLLIKISKKNWSIL